MSLKYQTDSYILYDESMGSNQSKHQELLFSTLKQLVEENKNMLKEHERFEQERSEKNLEIANLKKNLINLLTVAQYEYNRPTYGKGEFMNESKFHETILKRIELNYKNLKNINFSQVLKFKFLQQLVKNNVKEKDYLNHENTFDCRPYKGPKTPPTPNSKFRFNSSYINKNHHHLNNLKTKPTTWNIRDMIYYLKKYKEIFQIYRKTVAQNNFPNLDEKSQFQQICNNVFTPVAQEKSRNILEKGSSNDMEFYQDLIEKHNKSLAMIENVGNKVCPSLDLSKIPEAQLNTLLKDYLIATNSVSEVFNLNHINQIYNSLTTQFLMKNPLLITEQIPFSISNELLRNNPNEIFTPAILQSFPMDDSTAKPEKEVEKSENIAEPVAKPDDPRIVKGTDITHNANRIEENELQNNFEDGEIIDSGEESTEKKNINNKDNQISIDNKEKKDKKNKKSYKVLLKSVVTGKIKKPLNDHSKLPSKSGSLYSKYQRKCLNNDMSTSSRPAETLPSTSTSKLITKRDQIHSRYYLSEERLSSRHSRDDGERNVKDRLQLPKHRHNNDYFHKTRPY